MFTLPTGFIKYVEETRFLTENHNPRPEASNSKSSRTSDKRKGKNESSKSKLKTKSESRSCFASAPREKQSSLGRQHSDRSIKQNMASLTTEAAASSSSSSLPLSSTDHQNHYTYQVFLSFRGEDTRFNFTDHLHTALDDRGIKTFIDDELRRGEEISSALLEAIEESRVSIIVFSKNYASSRWCLDELVKILECRKSKGQEVRPVFYKVDPSDVRHQRGAFGDAFAELECKYKDSMDKWKAALTEAADLSGWPFKDRESEAKLIKRIVGDLSAQVINPSCELHVAEHPIGLESCRQDVIRLLDAKENNMVGIWGPGGIGKTTIAKDVFNSIRHKFEGSCFLTDFRSKGLAQLQETLLSHILISTLKVSSVDQGVSFIKTTMRHKKVFLILDDVSDSNQLQKLVPSPDCFGLGSRILITTRDKRWLIAHEVDEVYEVKMLNDHHALELFSLHAFKRNGPPSDYLELAQRAVRYAQGLPLALIVLGSHLFCKSREEWEATLGSCWGEDPHREIRDVLKISYDALGVDLKGYFLDIACFFKGKPVAHVKPILEACYDLKSVTGIAQLQEKALIRIDHETFKGGSIWMHDLIEEMGKNIVYQESPNEPGKRSRVWNEEDVNDVLTNNTGTNKVTGIQVPWPFSTIYLNAESFSKMKSLRYISMSRMMEYDSFSREIDYLSDQLRWLDWPNSPLQSFPSNFHANRLVKLNIPNSRRITRLWEGCKNCARLNYMNLSGCTSLRELPDFNRIPNLERLNLSGCTSLRELPYLNRIPNLERLNLSNCTSLKELPDLNRISNLERLNLSGCTSLRELPDFNRMPNLKELNLRGCSSLRKLSDFTGIPNLKELNLYGCSNLVEVPDSIGFLRNLVTLNVDCCSNLIMFPRKINWKFLGSISITCCKLKEFSEVGEELGFLRKLDLSGTCIKELHPSITLLIGLEELIVMDCQNLTTLPYNLYELHNLKYLDASNCPTLTTFPKIPMKMNSLRRLFLRGSDIKELDQSIGNLIGLEWLNLNDCINLTTLPCSIYELRNLKDLNASNCPKLAIFPEIPIKMDSLRTLFLRGSDIRELDQSIRNLIGLEWLNLNDCINLTTLPCNIYELRNLKDLDASNCPKLATFPEIPIKMDYLRRLFLRGSDIRELDQSIGNLIGLEWLNLNDCINLTTLPCNIYELRNLKFLNASFCLKLATFPEIPMKMDSLRQLLLEGSDIRELNQSIGNLIGLELLDLKGCKNLTTLPCSIYELQNLRTLNLYGCSKLVRFPRKTNILNVDGCLLSLPKLQIFDIGGCSLSDCDFLMTLDCWETLEWLNLSENNFVSVPACFTKFVNLRTLFLHGCRRLRGIPELPPNVKLAVIEAASPSIEDDDEEEPTVIPPKQQRTTGQPSMVHFVHNTAISPIPMIPDLHSSHHSTTPPQLQHQVEATELLRLALSSEPKTSWRS